MTTDHVSNLLYDRTTGNQKNNVFFYVILGCLIIGAITRIVYCLRYPVPVRDSFEYYEIIDVWNKTGRIPKGDCAPPLALFLLRLPSALFGLNILDGGICVNVLLSLLSIIVFMRLAQFFVSSWFFSVLIGIIFATHPQLVHLSCQPIREIPYLFFTILSIYAVILYAKRNRGYFLALCSFFTGCAILCRYEAIENIFLILLMILVLKGKKSLKKRIGTGILYAAGCFVSILFVLFLIGIPVDYYENVQYKIQEKQAVPATMEKAPNV